MAPRPSADLSPGAVGIGLRRPHYDGVLEGGPPLGFVEVHSENFFADGGAAPAVLRAARERYPVSLHGVGLALGSAAGLDPWHLDRLARLVQTIEPARVSDHASFARVAPAGARPVHAAELLPIAFSAAQLDILVRNVQRVQERLGRPILVENLSAYLSFTDDAIGEAEFYASLCRRSGCGLLLDLNNLMVNALNAVRDASPRGGITDDERRAATRRCRAVVESLPAGIVGEIHLAGHAQARDGLVVDDHGSRVDDAVWSLYAFTLGRLGAAPTLIEWDTDLPPLDVLLNEAAQAERLVAAHAPAAAAGGMRATANLSPTTNPSATTNPLALSGMPATDKPAAALSGGPPTANPSAVIA